MFRLSVILPAVGDEASFENTLVSVLENRPASCEVIVACPANFVDKYDLQKELQLVRVRTDRLSWMSLANVGVWAARGAYINLLLPGIEVLEDWDAPAIDRLQRTARTGAVTSLTIDDCGSDSSRAIAGLTCRRGELRSFRYEPTRQDVLRTIRVDGVPSWCGFFRRQDLLDFGGWNERLSESSADIDLALRLRRRRLASICEMASCVVLREDVLRDRRLTDCQRGRELEQLYWRHLGRLSWRALLGYPLSWVASAATPSILWGRLSTLGKCSPDWSAAEFQAVTRRQFVPEMAPSKAA